MLHIRHAHSVYSALKYTSIAGVICFLLRPHARSQHCNAAGGEYVNNLDENDASRRFPSQLTRLQHQQRVGADAMCASMTERQKNKACVTQFKSEDVGFHP